MYNQYNISLSVITAANIKKLNLWW